MAVIDLRGDVARSLARLGVSIGGIIGPNKEEKQQFRKLLATNPQLAEAFGRLERESPGTLRGIFPFLDEEIISGFVEIPPSVKEITGGIERGVLADLPPEAKQALGEFGVTGRFGTTPSELALEPKRVAAAEAITQEDVTAGFRREVTGLTPGGESLDAFRTEIFNTAMDSFNDLGLEEKELASLRDALPAAFFDEDNQESFRQRRMIAQMQIDAQNLERANERTDAFQRGVAARWTERTKTGLPETWQLFLFTTEMNDRAKGLADGSILPQNQTDIRLMEVANAFSRADQVDKSVEEAAIRTQIRAIIDRIGQLDSEGKFKNERTVRQVLAEQLNGAFVELSILTDGRVPIRIAEIPVSKLEPVFGFGPGNKALIIRDESGAEIDIGQNVERFQQGQGQEQEREISQQREVEGPAEISFPQDVVDFLDSLQQVGQGEVGPLNLETVDVSKLPEKTRNNLIAIMNGEGTFEELQAFDPVSAQLILDARRNR